MRRLILFRHAKTQPRPPGCEDVDRALVERGRVDAAVVGRALAEAGLAPDLVLVSPAARAVQTWECARASFPNARTQVRNGLYNATSEEVAAELKEGADGADTVMVVGHNPSLQELAVNLLIDGDGSAADIERLTAAFPTATAAAFLLGEPGHACLDGLFLARDHRDP